MNIGYARVSSDEQKPTLQIDALKAAGCERIFDETASGAKSERPGLEQALDFMRPGDSIPPVTAALSVIVVLTSFAAG